MKMRVMFFAAFSLLFFSKIAFGQLKIGYVDTKTILGKIPDAQDARQKLDGFIRDWQAELGKMEADRKVKQDDYDRRKLIMTEQTRNELEAEITKLDQQINDYRTKKFGTNGELFQKQDELMKPVQNKVFTAIQDVAKEDDLDFVFDRSVDNNILFAKDKYDITPQVMDKLKLQ